MYFNTTSIIALVLIFLLLALNIIYYRHVIRKIGSNKLRLFNFINRIILLIYLLFFYLHWPYREYILYGLYLFATLLLLTETIVIISNKAKRTSKYYWIDNAINILLILIMVRTYII